MLLFRPSFRLLLILGAIAHRSTFLGMAKNNNGKQKQKLEEVPEEEEEEEDEEYYDYSAEEEAYALGRRLAVRIQPTR